jgi:predicted DNA-binding transcriptional regulator AlpA
MSKDVQKTVIKPIFLNRESVAAFVALSVPTVERMTAQGNFPAPRQICRCLSAVGGLKVWQTQNLILLA